MTIDYANTAHALENRARKAEHLAAAARRLDVRAHALRIATGARGRVWREAGLTRSPSDLTWALALELLGPDPEFERPAKACYRHPDRPGRLYLGGVLCGEECAPWRAAGRPPVSPPAEQTLEALLRRRDVALARANDTKEQDQ